MGAIRVAGRKYGTSNNTAKIVLVTFIVQLRLQGVVYVSFIFSLTILLSSPPDSWGEGPKRFTSCELWHPDAIHPLLPAPGTGVMCEGS